MRENKIKKMKSEVVKLSYYIFDKVLFIEPIIESVINSIQAGADDIKIHTSRNSTLENQITKIQIKDNGVGFNKKNREDFNKIAETSKKIEKCRGIGRLSYLRIFDRVFFCSNYKDDEEFYNVRFFFNDKFTKIEQKDDKNIKNINYTKNSGTKIIFDKITQNLSDSDKKILKYDSNALLKHIISNKESDTFSSVIFTIISKEKNISISVDDESININTTNIEWKNLRYEYGVQTIEIKYAFHKFDSYIFNDSDYIAYQVGDRAVKEVFPAQKKFDFKGDKKGLSLICFVKCEILDKTTNNNWKNFNLNRKEWNDFNKFIQEKIYNEIVVKNLNSNIADEQKKQAIKDNPHLKPILETYVESDFLNGKEAVNRAIRKKEDILTGYFSSSSERLFNEEDINIIQQSALAELMIARFRTLEEVYAKCNSADALEKDIHNLLFTQRTNSNTIKNNNLWLLDARWQYSKHIESDNSIDDIFTKSIEEIYHKYNLRLTDDDEANIRKDKEKFNKRPDICIFNESSVVIVELKKPTVDLSFHIEKIKLYGALISFISKQKYRNIYGYLLGKDKPNLTDKVYKEDFDGMGYSYTTELALLEKNKNKRTDLSETTFYGAILEYNKFLKDCYFQHKPFFDIINKKIEDLEKFIPTK